MKPSKRYPWRKPPPGTPIQTVFQMWRLRQGYILADRLARELIRKLKEKRK